MPIGLRGQMDAGDRFALPMHLAYETGVVTTLPAIVYMVPWKRLELLLRRL
jgi:hypothetical protein